MFGFLISGCAEEKKPAPEPGKVAPAAVQAEAKKTEAAQPQPATGDNATTKETGGDNMTAPAGDNTTAQTIPRVSDNQTAGPADNATAPPASGDKDNASEAKKE